MKPRKLYMKLSLRKVTVVDLGKDVMKRVRGGAETRLPHLCTDYSFCEDTCTCHLSGDPNCLDTGIQCFNETNHTGDCTVAGCGVTLNAGEC